MISLKNINKKYGDKTIFENFNLEIKKGEILGILGESGSGKTTLLNILSGLTDFEGTIENNFNKKSMVFQNDRLVPNLKVKENILLINKNANVDEILQKVGLLKSKDEYIKNLSGGMARRVALARALSYDAPILLLDEPFINLDLALKLKLINVVKEYSQDKTVVFVTHDIKEAVLLSNRIMVLSDGKKVFDKENTSSDMEKVLYEIMINLKQY